VLLDCYFLLKLAVYMLKLSKIFVLLYSLVHIVKNIVKIVAK
jgi:hypothetical protein